MVSKLPDKGERIRAQLVDLKLQLEELRGSSSRSEPEEIEVIDVDDLADAMQRILSV